MILERFDGIVFIGDEILRHIYMAFNILLRKDLALGGMERLRMDEKQRGACRCDYQFTKAECYDFTRLASVVSVQKRDSPGEKANEKEKAGPTVCQRK